MDGPINEAFMWHFQLSKLIPRLDEDYGKLAVMGRGICWHYSWKNPQQKMISPGDGIKYAFDVLSGRGFCASKVIVAGGHKVESSEAKLIPDSQPSKAKRVDCPFVNGTCLSCPTRGEEETQGLSLHRTPPVCKHN